MERILVAVKYVVPKKERKKETEEGGL